MASAGMTIVDSNGNFSHNVPPSSSTPISSVLPIATGAATGSLFGPIGAIAGAGLGFLGGILDRRQAKQQYNQNRYDLQNAVSYRVEDALRAGVHPLLALGSNPAAATPATTTAPNAITSGLRTGASNVMSILQSLALEKQLANIDADTNVKNSVIKVQAADIPVKKAEASLLLAKAGYTKKEIDNYLWVKGAEALRNVGVGLAGIRGGLIGHTVNKTYNIDNDYRSIGVRY